MTSNKKLLQAWKNLDLVLKKDDEGEEYFKDNLYQGATPIGFSVKTPAKPIRPHSSYLVRTRPMTATSTKSGFKSSAGFNGTFTATSFFSKNRPTSPGAINPELVQMYSPKQRLFDEHTVLHSVPVSELKRIYEGRCIDNKTDSNVNQIKHFLDRFDQKCKKRIFNMEGQYIGANAAIEIANIIAENYHFINLNISKNSIGDVGARCIAAALRQNTTVVHINLSNNGIGHEGAAELFEMLEENETIVSFKLNSLEGLNRNRIDSRGMRPLATSLKSNQVLAFLDLSGSSITAEGLPYLAAGLEGNKSLISLNISDNELGPKCQQLVKSLTGSNLLELDISNNRLGDAGVQVLLGLFNHTVGSMTKLQTLDISGNSITGFGATKIFDVIAKNNSIRKLVMDNNNITGRGLASVLTLLWENPVLQHLSLYNCELNYEGADTLGAGLARNFHIETLIVGKNPFKDEGAKLLLTAIKDNQILKEMDLSGCKIREEGGKAIAYLISSNHNLTKIDLKDNNLYDQSGVALVEAVKINKKVTKLNLERNPVSYKYVIEIEKAMKANAAELSRLNATTFVKEMEFLKGFEAQKYVVAQEGRIFTAKQREVNEELVFHTQLMDQFKNEEASLAAKIEDEYADIAEEIRNINREKREWDDQLQNMKAKMESELHFIKFNIENTKQEIIELTKGVKKIKESTDQSRVHYERQIIKLKNEISDREKICNILDNTVGATETHIKKVRDGSPKSPTKGRKLNFSDKDEVMSPKMRAPKDQAKGGFEAFAREATKGQDKSKKPSKKK